MKRKPMVTVLMPVYNGGEYLRLSIESILAQTYKDFELLIINDCSTDNSMEVVRSFNDARIVVHNNAVNMGQTKSLNVGLRLAKGRYIVVNDADDLSLTQRIEKQLDFIMKHPEYAVVGTSAFIMDRSGRIRRHLLKSTDHMGILLCILNDTPVIHGSVIMDKNVIMSQGGYDEEFRICQDYAFWSFLIRKGFQIANIPDRMVVIRHYMDSISFKEKDAQTLENGKIIYENVIAMTTLKITHEEAIRQRMFFAAPERLDKGDFKKAEELFVSEYKNLKNQGSFDPGFILQRLRSRMVKPFSKLAIAEFKSGRLKEARATARDFIKRYGFSSIPFMIWMASYSSKIVLDVMLAFYEKWHEILVRRSAVWGR